VNQDKQEKMSRTLTLTIEAGLDHAFPFDVDKDMVLSYSFNASDFIYFSVGYDDNKQNKLMTWTKDGAGAFLCTKKGKVVFEFDNSKSWLKGATLTLKIELEEPLASGLEKPICFQISSRTKLSPELENKIFRIKTPSTMTTKEILQSGRRLLAFESSSDCNMLTGRFIEFSLSADATDKDLLSKLKGDTHPFLYGKKHNIKPPKVVLGSMTFDNIAEETSAAIVKTYAAFNPECDEVDTAFAYGKAEAVLGKVLVPKYPKMIMATKVNPWAHSGRSLSPQDMRTQITASFKNLGVKKVNILYLHQPDINTPLEVTLGALDKFHKEGLFQELGLSNFAAWQVVLVYHICKEKGWVVPTVYQGMYNVLTRDVEPELFPALRAHNIRFYAYNPLAGGLLTGRYTSLQEIPKYGRFAKNTTLGGRYLDRFWHPSYFEAMKVFQEACTAANISIADASFRWMAYHSMLETSRGDAVIVGASSLGHMNSNMAACASTEPLPQAVVNAADKAWNMCKNDCPRYFRK
jgi:aflatoxin B1 aldehyde reductase